MTIDNKPRKDMATRVVQIALWLLSDASSDTHFDLRTISMAKAKGKVKWFDSKKGYGFIQPDDGGRDVFVHITALRALGVESLMENQPILYDLVTERGKTSAGNLQLV
jgi:CspA family cold shock protein